MGGSDGWVSNIYFGKKSEIDQQPFITWYYIAVKMPSDAVRVRVENGLESWNPLQERKAKGSPVMTQAY